MADADDLVVTVETEAEQPTIAKVEPQTEKKAGDTARTEPADELSAQFKALQQESERHKADTAEARRRAAVAAQEAETARREAAAARSEVVSSQVETVETGLAAARGEADAAEREYKAAFEAGDGAAAAKAQRKIAQAEARIARLDEAKADLETRVAKKTPTEADEVRKPTPPAVDPLEAYIAGRSEPTAAWLRAHPDWITDQRKNAKLTAAHFDATGEGITVDTPEYFEHVEKFIGLKQDAPAKTNGANGHEPPKTKRAVSPPAAPVTQSGGGTSGSTGREVTLTKGEAAAATDGTVVWNFDDPSPQKRFKKGDPVGIQEFARRKYELQRQGAYDRTFTEQ